MTEITLFYVPISKDNSDRLITDVLNSRLVACVNKVSLESSHYFWQGSLEVDKSECVLLMKTSNEKVKALSDWLEERHPYDVPCLINFKVAVNKSYHQWVLEQLA